jgi:uncharacterized protein
VSSTGPAAGVVGVIGHTAVVDGDGLVAAHTVLSVVVGPVACGLADPDLVPPDELPRRGVFAPPAELFWRFAKPPAEVAGPGPERFSWELEPFCALALAGAPAAFDVLGSPLVEHSTPVGDELRELVVAFRSQRAADAYRRATATEFARAAAAHAGGGTPRWPQLAEVLRLLICVERLLRTGELSVDASAHAAELGRVRAGETSWREVSAWVESLRDRTAEAVLRSPLPPAPNTEAVQRWLASVRRRSLSG